MFCTNWCWTTGNIQIIVPFQAQAQSFCLIHSFFWLTPSQYAITLSRVLTELQLIAIHYSYKPCNIYILIRMSNSR